MPHIVLTEEQARIVAESKNGVEVRGPEGEIVAYFKPMSPEEAAHIADALRRHAQRGSQPRQGIPSAQVQAHMRRLEEIRQAEGMDEAKMYDLLRRMRAGEVV